MVCKKWLAYLINHRQVNVYSYLEMFEQNPCLNPWAHSIFMCSYNINESNTYALITLKFNLFIYAFMYELIIYRSDRSNVSLSIVIVLRY